MFEGIVNFFKKASKKEALNVANSKNTAKERLHLVLMQDRANVSADFLDLMRQEIIEVIKKYIDIDETAMDVRLTNQANDDGTQGAPALYANIPIVNIKDKRINKKNIAKTKSEENFKVNNVEGKHIENSNNNIEGKHIGNSNNNIEGKHTGNLNNNVEGKHTESSNNNIEGKHTGNSNNNIEGKHTGNSNNNVEGKHTENSDNNVEGRHTEKIGNNTNGKHTENSNNNIEGKHIESSNNNVQGKHTENLSNNVEGKSTENFNNNNSNEKDNNEEAKIIEQAEEKVREAKKIEEIEMQKK